MTPYYEEPDATIYQGHALDVLRGMPAGSVDCVITSPPYWGLRAYKTEPIIWDDHAGCEHEWGDQQGSFCLKCHAWNGELGLEPTIELYVSHLLVVFDEVKRVLKKTGTLWVNMGDSYAASAPGHCRTWQHGNDDNRDSSMERRTTLNLGISAKSLCLIPERFALGMVERGWILRNNIIWVKSNPMPESVKDRFTGTYEYVYFFTKAQRYWFEQQFEQYTEPMNRWGGDILKADGESTWDKGTGQASYRDRNMRPNSLGRNKRDVWEINTQPYPGAHFAVFPEKLVETPILAGCAWAICKKCGKAREKIIDREITFHSGSGKSGNIPRGKWEGQEQETSGSYDIRMGPKVEIIDKGYTDCRCDADFEPGVVMDIFAGSGTTGAVAKRLGRKYIGIELSDKYCKLHRKRLQAVPLAMELA